MSRVAQLTADSAELSREWSLALDRAFDHAKKGGDLAAMELLARLATATAQVAKVEKQRVLALLAEEAAGAVTDE